MEGLYIYDKRPAGMDKYLSNYGWHFSKNMYIDAVKGMKDRDDKKMNIMTKNEIIEIFRKYDMEYPGQAYDACYVFMMAKSDFWNSSIQNEQQLVKFVNDYIGDIDGYDGIALTRYYADCVAKGKVIMWEEML